MTKDEIIREDILAAAKELFERYGLNKTTMEDIAKSAGKGKSTLYYYFKSKEEIFDEMIKNSMKETLNQVQNEVDKAETAFDKIIAFAVVRLRSIHQKTILNQVLLQNIQDNPKIIQRVKKDFEQREVDLLVKIFEFGIARNEIHEVEGLGVSLRDMAFILNRSQHGLESVFLEDGSDALGSIIDKFEGVLAFFLKGVIKK